MSRLVSAGFSRCLSTCGGTVPRQVYMAFSYDDNTRYYRKKTKKVLVWSSGNVPIHHCLAAIGTARHLKLNRMELLSAIRVNPGIQRTCASCQMQRRWRVWLSISTGRSMKRGQGKQDAGEKLLDPDNITSGRNPQYCSSCPHVLGVRALGDDCQPRIGLLGDGHCGERK